MCFGYRKLREDVAKLYSQMETLRRENRILRYYALRTYREVFKEKGEKWMGKDLKKYIELITKEEERRGDN